MERVIRRVRRSRIIVLQSPQLRHFLHNLQARIKAQRHRRARKRRLYYRIRRKYIYMTCNKHRFKKIQKVENQTCFGSEIMEMILSQLGTQYLKVCRLVCKSWNQEACRILRKNSNVELDTPEMCQDLHRLMNSGRILQLPHPFAQLSVHLSVRRIADFETRIHLLRKYRLHVGRLRIRHLEIPESIDDPPLLPDSFQRYFIFLKECAPVLTYLSSPLWACELPPELQEPYLSLQFPNLGTLVLVRGNPPPVPSQPQGKERWLQRILVTSPKLVNLSCPAFTFSINPGTLLDLKNIQKLDYDLDAPTSSLYSLLTLASTCKSITSLSVDSLMLEDESQLTTLKEIIARVGATLEILYITETSAELELTGEFPDCPKLHTLSVFTYLPDLLNLNALTSLKSLEFEYIHFTDFAALTAESQVYLNVEEIKFRASFTPTDEPDFERLFKLFPNAVSWSIHSATLSLLCRVVRETGKKIKHLRLKSWRGEDTKACKDLLHLQDLEELDLVYAESLHEGEMNIFRQLSNLRILRIYFYRLQEDQIQNVVRDLVLHAPELEHLDKTVILHLPSKDNFELVELICTQITSAEFE